MITTEKTLLFYIQTDSGSEVRHWVTYAVDPAYTDEQWKAEKGQAQLALMAECCGKSLEDVARKGTEVLHGIPFIGTVQHVDSKQTKEDGTPFKNAKFTNFKKHGGTTQQSTGNDAPW